MTTAGKLWDWATYTVPDADQRFAERQALGYHPGLARLDQMRESPLGAIAFGTAQLFGASPETQELALGLGTATDGLLMSFASLDRPMAFTGANRPKLTAESELVGRVRNLNAYLRTRETIERELFRTPKDELSVVISRETGLEVARQLVPGTGGPLTRAMQDSMRGNTFTHFHPKGGTFSFSDISTALINSASELRAVTADKIFSMNFERAPSGFYRNESAIKTFISGEQLAATARVSDAVSRGLITNPYNATPVDYALFQAQANRIAIETIVARNPWIKYTVAPANKQ